MALRTGMTVSDYFQLAGIKNNLNKSAQTAAVLGPSSAEEFRQILAKTGNLCRSSSGKKNPSEACSEKPGLRLTDYFKNPVIAKPLHSTSVKKTLNESSSLRVKANRSGLNQDQVLTPSKKTGAKEPPDDPTMKINQCIKKAAARYGVSTALVRSVIRAESNFQVYAISPAGAQGLMQLMPGTAKELGVEDAFDIEANVEGGTRYLKQMLDQFDGDLKLALAAYNAGPGTVRKYGDIPPFHETRTYVERVMKYMEKIS